MGAGTNAVIQEKLEEHPGYAFVERAPEAVRNKRALSLYLRVYTLLDAFNKMTCINKYVCTSIYRHP